MSEFELPLVSVIVTAHNYARFLGAALESVAAQSYSAIECIVVDDGSSDETPELLSEATRRHTNMKAIRNETAVGQAIASRMGFEASRGQYVVFLDGDDLLCRDFVRDHVFVNLSSRVAVGFTSSDIYQVVDGQLVVSTGESMNTVFLKPPEGLSYPFRPLAAAPDGPWPYDGPALKLLEGVRHVPAGQAQWCWSPTTANMFRRDALDLFIGFEAFDALTTSTDVFLCTGISLLCGSFLIDKPLSVYRIHGDNLAARHAQLANVRAVKPDAEFSLQAKMRLVEHLTQHARELCERLWWPPHFLNVLRGLEADMAAPGPGSYLSACLDRYRGEMVAAVGQEALDAWNPPPADIEAPAPPQAADDDSSDGYDPPLSLLPNDEAPEADESKAAPSPDADKLSLESLEPAGSRRSLWSSLRRRP